PREEGVRFGPDMLGSAVTPAASRLTTPTSSPTKPARPSRTSSSASASTATPTSGVPSRTPTSSATSSRAPSSPVPGSTSASSRGSSRSRGSGSPSGVRPPTPAAPPSSPGTTPAWSPHPSWSRRAGCATAATSGSFAPPPATSTSAQARPPASRTHACHHPRDAHTRTPDRPLTGSGDALAARHGVQVAWERMAKTAVVPFPPGIQQLLAATVDDLGLPYVRAMSGAGHDAQEISAICPTAMVFVAGENGGISHTPRAYSTPRACANGTDVLANAVLRLADQP